jgi:glycosyltransferase involved in cell wall biosynthesis
MVMEKEKKNIWYISHYVAPPEFDTHSRALKFTHYLSQAGFKVTIFSSSYLHNKNRNLISDNRKYLEKTYDNTKFVLINTIEYKNSTIKRIFALIQFSLRIYSLRNKFERPDVIIHTAQVPFENLIYYVAKKLKAKYIPEVLDLWPESFVEYGLINKKNPFIKLAYFTEKWVYKKADRIIFSMEGGKDYIIEKKWNRENNGPIVLSKVYHINNGVDLKDFEANKNNYKIQDTDLEDENSFKVIYLGSIRLANNLKQLIDAAKLLKSYSNIKFLIYGDGPEREKLEKFCSDNNLINVKFKQKWIELKYVPYVLSKSSLNIINYMPSGILKYGGSQGKLFQYLSSGKPIISNIKMGYCIIDKYNLGISKDIKTATEYSEAILQIALLNKTEYDKICNRAREAVKQYDYNILTEELIKVLNFENA